jgi:hypothetical protein
MQQQDIQPLSEAFVEKAQECGVKLFPETAEELAREIYTEIQGGNLTPLEALVKEKFNSICGKEVEASIYFEPTGLNRLASRINNMLKAIAQAVSGPITQQEIDDWHKRIVDDVYVPFQNIGLEVSGKVRDLMSTMEKLAREKKDLEMKVAAEGLEVVKSYKAKAGESNPNGPKNRTYRAKRSAVIALGENATKKKKEFNSARAMAVYLTGTSEYIKDTVRIPENFGTQIDGASTYLKEMGIVLGDITNIINTLKDSKDPNSLKLPELAREAEGRWTIPSWIMRSVSNNPTLVSQSALIGPSVDNIDINALNNSWTSVVFKKRLWDKINQQNPSMAQDKKVELYKTQLGTEQASLMQKIDKINQQPATWKKFREMYEILDPQSPEAWASLMSAKEETPNSWISEPTKIQSVTPTAADIASGLALKYLNKKNPRAWSQMRKLSEAQDESSHWSLLYVLSNLSDLKYDTKTGKTYGEDFLDSLPADKRADPLMIQAAQKIDGIMSEKRSEVAMQIVLNKNVPDWILMKLASIGYRAVSTDDKAQKEMDDVYDFIRKISYEILQDRGWKLKRDGSGSVVSQKLPTGDEIAFIFEKTGAKKASVSQTSIKTAQQGGGALEQLQGQMRSLDQQITGIQQQLSQKQSQKGELNKKMQAEQERTGQIQQADQQAKAQKAMSDAAQAPTNQAPGAGIGTDATGGGM